MEPRKPEETVSMEGDDVSTLHGTVEDWPENLSAGTSFFVPETSSGRNSIPKCQRTSDDAAPLNSTDTSQVCGDSENAIVRMILRCCTYFVYDGVSLVGGRKEVARIGKAIVELLVDERFPPPHRSDMSIGRKGTEFLVAPAASSLAWFIIRKLRASGRKRLPGEQSKAVTFVWAKALWAVIHRVARQALIYRLFFRIGSLRYSLASVLGIICCFFKDSLFPHLLSLRKWPLHFSPSQGLAALFRSVVYAVSFSLPVQNISKTLEDSARRRGNVKKLLFAVILSQLHNLRGIGKLVSEGQSWTV